MLAGPATRPGAPGLILGTYKGRWVVDRGDQHIGLPWPSGRGKTRRFLLQNLVNWRGSVVVLDLLEIFHERTAGWRSSIGDVFLFRPLSDQTHCLNPLDFLPSGGAMVTELQDIVATLVPMGDRDTGAPWRPSAQTLAFGLLYYLLNTPGQAASFGRLARLVDHEDGLHRFMRHLIDEHKAGKRRLPDLCRMIFSGYLECAHETREGYRLNLRAALSVFMNPYVDAATSSTSPDLDPRRMRERPMTVYLSMPVKYLKGPLGRLMSLMIDTIHSANLDRTAQQDPRVRVPLWMAPDEVGQLPRLESLSKMTAARNFGVRWCLPFQDTPQMREIYGPNPAASLLANCDTKLVVSTSDMAFANAISDALSTTTRTMTSRATNRLGQSNVEAERTEPLVWRHEIREMDADKILAVPDGKRAFYIDKLDIDAAAFADRLDLPAPPVPWLKMVSYDDIERVPAPEAEEEAPRPRRKPAAKAKPGDFEAEVAKSLGREA